MRTGTFVVRAFESASSISDGDGTEEQVTFVAVRGYRPACVDLPEMSLSSAEQTESASKSRTRLVMVTVLVDAVRASDRGRWARPAARCAHRVPHWGP